MYYVRVNVKYVYNFRTDLEVRIYLVDHNVDRRSVVKHIREIGHDGLDWVQLV
jgi:hypothetical protein